MEIIIAVSFVLLFVTIPVGLFFIAAKSYGDGTKLLVVVLKFLAAFILHLTASVIAFVFIIMVAVGADPGHGGSYRFGLEAAIICPLIVAAYALLGWLSCSFINKGFVKSYADFNIAHGKPQSLSLNKY